MEKYRHIAPRFNFRRACASVLASDLRVGQWLTNVGPHAWMPLYRTALLWCFVPRKRSPHLLLRMLNTVSYTTTAPLGQHHTNEQGMRASGA